MVTLSNLGNSGQKGSWPHTVLNCGNV